MSIFLDGIAIRFYGGIGSTTQYISPFSMMNFFIGPNNSGKSIVLNTIAQHLLESVKCDRRKSIDPVEMFRGNETGSFFIGNCVNSNIVLEALIERIAKSSFQ